MDLRTGLLWALAGIAVGLLVVHPLADAPAGQPLEASSAGPGPPADLGPPVDHPRGTPVASPGTEPASGPNLLVILTDDQPAGTLSAMPAVRERIAGEGVRFTSAYATTPLCCPSRASILTGEYAHEHGVRDNDDVLRESTVPRALADAGYVNGWVGKFMNSWNGTPREPYHYWVAFENKSYDAPTLNVNGEVRESPYHTTRGLAEHVLNFLDRTNDTDRPFFLAWAPWTPHYPAEPTSPLAGSFPDADPSRWPAFNETRDADKPAWVREVHVPGEAWSRAFYRAQLATLHALDHQVARVLDALEDQGRLDDTAVVFLSDQGYLHGQHGLVGKRVPYEPAVRIPLAVRFPPLAEANVTRGELVANLDIAPTLRDLAGLPGRDGVAGRSLVPLLNGSAGAWRDALLLEGWPPERPNWTAVHTGEAVYVETRGQRSELYDLAADPHQLHSRVRDPAYADLRDRLDRRLAELGGDRGPG